MVMLYGVGGTMAGAIFPLEEGATLIGRDTQKCAVIYPASEPGISSLHCQIVPKDNCVEITDLGSSYGTFMENGVKLQKNMAYTLQNGERFYLGLPQNKYMIKIK